MTNSIPILHFIYICSYYNYYFYANSKSITSTYKAHPVLFITHYTFQQLPWPSFLNFTLRLFLISS